MRRLVSRRVQALRQIEGWPVSFAAAGVVTGDGRIETWETRATQFVAIRLEAVAALAVLSAAEGGRRPGRGGGPPGSTVRHLLRTSGLPFEGEEPIARPGRRRIYSNEGFRVLAAHLADRAEMPFADYVRAAICQPLGIALDPAGDPGSGMHASLGDMLAIAASFSSPYGCAGDAGRDGRRSVPGPLGGVLPDHGRFDPLNWGLGVQINTRPATDGDEDLLSRSALRGLGDISCGSIPMPRPRVSIDASSDEVGQGSLARPIGCGHRGAVARARDVVATQRPRSRPPSNVRAKGFARTNTRSRIPFCAEVGIRYSGFRACARRPRRTAVSSSSNVARSQLATTQGSSPSRSPSGHLHGQRHLPEVLP